MRPKSYTTEGFILSMYDYGEADKIIQIYSKDFGKLNLIAKGVKRPTSKKRGHLDIFNKIRLHSIVGRNMDILSEVQVIDDFANVRTSLKRISLGYFFCEIISKITNEHEINIELFRNIEYFFQKLKITNGLKKLRQDFIYDTLVTLGYWPLEDKLIDHDEVLSRVVERKINSIRIGKIISI